MFVLFQEKREAELAELGSTLHESDPALEAVSRNFRRAADAVLNAEATLKSLVSYSRLSLPSQRSSPITLCLAKNCSCFNLMMMYQPSSSYLQENKAEELERNFGKMDHDIGNLQV